MEELGADLRKGEKLSELRDLVAVPAVCSEPVSGHFPVQQGKNREKARISASLGHATRPRRLQSQVFLVEFPTRWSGETVRAEQGNAEPKQGVVFSQIKRDGR